MQRRDFMQAAALSGLGATAFSASAVAAAQASTWAADLIVVGAGTAGLPAAIQAADLGLKVLLIDKNPAIGGTLHVTGGYMSAANTRMQIEKGFIDAPATHYRDVRRIGRYKNDAELVKLDVDHAGPMIDWLEDIGVEFTPESPVIYYGHEHYGVPRTHMPLNGGRSILESFRRELDKRVARGRIELKLGAKVSKLITAANGQVLGVSVEGEGGAADLYAGAVILSTGGYGASDSLRAKHNPRHKSAFYGGLPHSTGDGIVMAEQIGAKLLHMDNIIPVPGILRDPGKPNARLFEAGRVQLSWEKFRGSVWVNKLGERFVNEDEFGQDGKERALMRQPDMTFFVLFDEKARRANQSIVSGWSQEKFLAEAESGAVVKKAASLNALARSLDIDPKKLQATVERYNAQVAAGVDEDFDRDKMLYPLAEAPFYALQTYGFFLLTMGGVKVNHLLQVESENGPIPGLYAAGEVLGNGQTAGDGLVGGMSVTPAIVFGRFAARHAADFIRSLRGAS